MTHLHTHKRFWIGWDRHAPQSDPVVDRICREFLADFKPHHRIAGGDWQTVDQVSNFNNESDFDLKDEFDENERTLLEFKITHYLEGNHEYRLRRLGTALDKRLRSLVDLAKNLHLKTHGIRLLPYHPQQGILRLGSLKILHGFYYNEYMAKKTAMIYGTCVFGHAHRFQTFQSREAFDNHVGFSIGMMGRTNQTWAETHAPMGWAQGFAFGYIHRNGWFDLYPVRINRGRVCINGKVYGVFK